MLTACWTRSKPAARDWSRCPDMTARRGPSARSPTASQTGTGRCGPERKSRSARRQQAEPAAVSGRNAPGHAGWRKTTSDEGPLACGHRSLPLGGISWQCGGDVAGRFAMSAVDIIVILAAAAALAGLGWFFFGPRKATAAVLAGGVQRLEVTVKGGYSPAVLRARPGAPAAPGRARRADLRPAGIR